MKQLEPYLTNCTSCNGVTSRKYAKEHGGHCKSCADPDTTSRSSHPTRNERLLESGFEAYAREEGYYD